MTDLHDWQPIMLAPAEEEVWTKIDDGDGVRNVRKLTRFGNLWHTKPSRSSMYVYYTPTHWSRT